MNTVRDFYYHVETITDDYINFLGSFRTIYDGLLREMAKIVDRLKRIPNASVNDLTEQEDKILYITWLMTQILFNILKTPLLREKGIFKKEIEIEPKAANVLEASREITNKFNNAYVSGNEISNSTMDKFFALTGAKRVIAKETINSSTASNATSGEKGKSSLGCSIMFILFLMSLAHFYLGNKGIGFGLIIVIVIIDWLFG